MARVCFFEADTPKELNTSYYRCRIPAKALAAAGHDVYLSHAAEFLQGNKVSAQTLDAVANADAIVIERLLLSGIHPYIKEWREVGKRVYATWDDAYQLMPLSGGASRFSWGKEERPKTQLDKLYEEHGVEKPKPFSGLLNEFRQGLRLVTGGLVPSKLLAQDYHKWCAKIKYVPNFLDLELWKDVKANQDTDKIVIGWGGTSAHLESWKNNGVVTALSVITRKYPKVSVHIQTTDAGIIGMLTKAGVRFTTGGWQKFEDWPKVVGQFTIGIAPLNGNYDSRRSNLKVQEYAMAGMPWVATDDFPYDDAYGGFRVDNNRAQDWQYYLERLINDPQERKYLAAQGHAWVTAQAHQCAAVYEEALQL